MRRAGKKSVRVRHGDALSRLSWQDFEHRIAQHFRGLGYRVEHTGTGNRGLTDGGIDLKVYNDNEYIVVQCKHWNAFQVPHNDVHQLIGVMQTERATSAIIVTTGEFTRAAIDAGMKYPQIQLVDGVMVRNMLGPIPEPTYAFLADEMDAGWRQRPARRQQDATPVLAAATAVGIMTVTMIALYAYYVGTVERATAQLTRTPVVTSTPAMVGAATRAPGGGAQPHTLPPITTVDGHPVHFDNSPSTDADLAAWKRKNNEAMRILEKTTPEL